MWDRKGWRDRQVRRERLVMVILLVTPAAAILLALLLQLLWRLGNINQ